MSIFSLSILHINFINIVPRLIVDFYQSPDFYQYDDQIDVADNGYFQSGVEWCDMR